MGEYNMQLLVGKILSFVMKSRSVDDEEKDLLAFGIEQGLFLLLNFITMIVIGIWCGMIWQITVFTFSYLLLRSYVGGYHARTQVQCYIISQAIVVLFLFLIVCSRNWDVLGIGVLWLLSTGVIVAISPVEDKNKPLDDVEKRVYRRRSLLLLVGWSVVTLVLRFLGLTEASNAVVLAIALCGIMALLGKIKFIV